MNTPRQILAFTVYFKIVSTLTLQVKHFQLIIRLKTETPLRKENPPMLLVIIGFAVIGFYIMDQVDRFLSTLHGR